jgi:hypothetical protein
MQPGASPLNVEFPPAPDSGGAVRSPLPARAPYVAPVLERLGRWEAFTLQQSIPIFP